MKRPILGLVASGALVATLVIGTAGAALAGNGPHGPGPQQVQTNTTPGQCPYGHTPAGPMNGAFMGERAGAQGPRVQRGIGQAVNGVTAAFQQRSGAGLKLQLGTQLQQRLHSQTAQRLANCLPAGSSVKVLDRTVTVNGTTAKVTVQLAITTPDGKTTQVQRVWTFAKQSDGTWKLSTLPSCPLKP